MVKTRESGHGHKEGIPKQGEVVVGYGLVGERTHVGLSGHLVQGLDHDSKVRDLVMGESH